MTDCVHMMHMHRRFIVNLTIAYDIDVCAAAQPNHAGMPAVAAQRLIK